MNEHSRLKMLLYEYVQGELAPSDQRRVEEHLRVCDRCAEDADQLKRVIALAHPARKASDERGEEFWNTFPLEVERKIRRVNSLGRRERFTERIRGWIPARPTHAIGLVGAVAVVVLSVIVSRTAFTPTVEEQAHPIEVAEINPAALSADRMNQYFRKSKTLFVGLTNMKADEGRLLDLDVERKLSRELIHEARYLKQHPIDLHSARLISDMEKILIELANLEETSTLPDVDIIRSGIRHENLLFKVRMAQSVYDSVRFVRARKEFERSTQ